MVEELLNDLSETRPDPAGRADQRRQGSERDQHHLPAQRGRSLGRRQPHHSQDEHLPVDSRLQAARAADVQLGDRLQGVPVRPDALRPHGQRHRSHERRVAFVQRLPGLQQPVAAVQHLGRARGVALLLHRAAGEGRRAAAAVCQPLEPEDGCPAEAPVAVRQRDPGAAGARADRQLRGRQQQPVGQHRRRGIPSGQHTVDEHILYCRRCG